MVEHDLIVLRIGLVSSLLMAFTLVGQAIIIGVHRTLATPPLLLPYGFLLLGGASLPVPCLTYRASRSQLLVQA